MFSLAVPHSPVQTPESGFPYPPGPLTVVRTKHRPAGLYYLLLLGWFFTCSGGFLLLIDQASRPCETTAGQLDWPTESHITRVHGFNTLLLFVHPNCPCTAATQDELDRILAHCNQPVRTILILAGLARKRIPAERLAFLQNWCARRQATELLIDDQRHELHYFQARTSGHLLLFDPSGRLLFSGGITSGRGHRGPSSSGEQLARALDTRSGPAARLHAGLFPVYGCPLVESD